MLERCVFYWKNYQKYIKKWGTSQLVNLVGYNKLLVAREKTWRSTNMYLFWSNVCQRSKHLNKLKQHGSLNVRGIDFLGNHFWSGWQYVVSRGIVSSRWLARSPRQQRSSSLFSLATLWPCYRKFKEINSNKSSLRENVLRPLQDDVLRVFNYKPIHLVLCIVFHKSLLKNELRPSRRLMWPCYKNQFM